MPNEDNSSILNSWALVLFSISAFIEAVHSGAIKKIFSSRWWMLSFLFFLWLALTYFWDSSGGYSIKELERYALFLIIPAIMAAIPRIPAKKVIWTCLAFVLSTTIVTIICLIKSLLEYRLTGDYRVFYYHYLSQQMGISAIYLSDYCVAAITWLLYFAFVYQGTQPVKKGLAIVSSIYLSFIVFLLSSKMVIFILFVLLVYFVLYIGFLKKKIWISVVIILSVLIAGLVALRQLPYLRWRMSVTKIEKYSGGKDDQNGLAIRSVMWTSAMELIHQRPIGGYGIRGANIELQKKYNEKNFEIGLAEKFNCHNQYLETTLKSGIIGLLIFLSILISALITGIRQKNFLLAVLVIHYLCTSVVESTIEVQRGLAFFFFFISLFYYHSPDRIKNEEKILLQ